MHKWACQSYLHGGQSTCRLGLLSESLGTGGADGTATGDFRTMLCRLSCQQECVSHCLGEQVKAVKDTNSWCSLVSVGTLQTPPMPSDVIRSLRPASLPELSLGSSVLGSESCLHRGVSGSGLVSGWFQKTEPHRLRPPCQLPPNPSFDLRTRWDSCA